MEKDRNREDGGWGGGVDKSKVDKGKGPWGGGEKGREGGRSQASKPGPGHIHLLLELDRASAGFFHKGPDRQ